MTHSIINNLNEYLHATIKPLTNWLQERLPQISESWWDDCVMVNLSDIQYDAAIRNNVTSLDGLDLSALLRVLKYNWYDLCRFDYQISPSDKYVISKMQKLRNTWAHLTGTLPEPDEVIDDCRTIASFITIFQSNHPIIPRIEATIDELSSETPSNSKKTESHPKDSNASIKQGDFVLLAANKSEKGYVVSISEIAGQKKYLVFINNEVRSFFDGQILPVENTEEHEDYSIEEISSNLTAYQLRIPATSNLYSLNTAKIDFVPYQFMPALKIIQSDRPRLLIADSVGVGKTIESGLIIKELEARGELTNILIVCPKALVSERKWEVEMQRFGEDFLPVRTGLELNDILNATDRDGEWPIRYSRAIIPYSLLTRKAVEGEGKKQKRRASFCFKGLQTPPHFDVLIVDEAHHIRNRSTDAYNAISYLASLSDTVVFLTATPIMLGDEDLFTLLNVLRPDLFIDKESFKVISEPNKYINEAISAARSNSNRWKTIVKENLRSIPSLRWGYEVIYNKPEYREILELLEKEKVVREDRITIINKLEKLNTFSDIINRTRRKDIQDFCERRTNALKVDFTYQQRKIFNSLLQFEASALTMLHGDQSVAFMMSTINRQAASCIFGLSGFIETLIHKRMDQVEELEIDEISTSKVTLLQNLADNLSGLIQNLPPEDPKYDEMLGFIQEKQKQENNKIIIFSSFLHTLKYLKSKLSKEGYRCEIICGSVKDDVRFSLRERFALNRKEVNAIDILLFTEVGSEGLDYQFCNMMINYDLPWNPMKIEQRIGRIDRRGQLSKEVSIINMLTSDTVDAEIYDRCLMRIGIFEKSIGECEDILGAITKQIKDIVLNPELTPEELHNRLEKIADMEIRQLQARQELEDKQKQLFGFDLQDYSKSVERLENPWLSSDSLITMMDCYLQKRLGEGNYILRKTEAVKSLRLSAENRAILLEDFKQLKNNPKSATYRDWSKYLRSNEPILQFTLNGEIAQHDHNLTHVSINHPLVKQAAAAFSNTKTMFIAVSVSGQYPPGEYPFSIYSWDYQGYRPERKLITVCDNDEIKHDVFDILKTGSKTTIDSQKYESAWSELEGKLIPLWKEERKKYEEITKQTATTKLASLTNSYTARLKLIEQTIEDTIDPNIRRMKQQETANVLKQFEEKKQEINDILSRIDILSSLVLNGVVIVEE